MKAFFVLGEGKERFMYKKVKEMPLIERPYEKCRMYGASSLSDRELLAIILRSGTKDCSSIELADQIYNLHPVHHGMIGLPYLSYEALISIKGIGMVKAVQILCIVELSKRLSMSKAKTRLKLASPASIADYYMESMRHLQQEQLIVMMLDGKNQLIKDCILTVGTINSSLVSPREIYLEALHYEAVNLILVHNHPSGDSTPSQQDIQVTNRVLKAGKLIGIHLLDHIILGEHQYTSLYEEGLILY